MDQVAVIAVDPDGAIRHWNDGAEELFGYSASTVIGASLDLIIPEHLRATHWAGFRRAMAHPRSDDLIADIPVLTAAGNIATYAGRITVLTDCFDNALGAMATFRQSGTTGTLIAQSADTGS